MDGVASEDVPVTHVAAWRGALYVRYVSGVGPLRAGLAALDASTGRAWAGAGRAQRCTAGPISDVEWGWHEGDGPAGAPPAATIDDHTGRRSTWKPDLEPWTLTYAIAPNRAGVLIAGEFRESP